MPIDPFVAKRCGNSIKDGSEVGVDCGGDCANSCILINAILQPDSTDGIDALVHLKYVFTNYYKSPMQIVTWDLGAGPYTTRSLLNFDYSSIPSNASIVSATLTLFADTTTDYSNNEVLPGHSTYGGNNITYLEQITDPWNDKTVTWNNQPSSDYYTRIALPTSTTRDQAYTIDVSNIVKNEFATGSHYGFLLLNPRDQLKIGLVFYSSESKYAQLRPKLSLTYIQ